MKNTQSLVALAVVAGLTVFSGLWQGRIAHRWGAPSPLVSAAKMLEEVPDSFGDWRLQSASSLDQTALDQLECAGQFVRTYVNNRTGEVVIATLIVGPAGPTSVHTPEICLSSRDYIARGERQRIPIKGIDGNEQFWSVDFQSKNAEGELLRVCYGWSGGERWAAPADARFAFAGSPYLYKLQVSKVFRAGENVRQDATTSQFLQDFVAAAREHMAAPPPN